MISLTRELANLAATRDSAKRRAAPEQPVGFQNLCTKFMNALQAKIRILSYLHEFNETWPSKQDYTSLPILLKSDKVQIPQSEFARSVISSLVEDEHVQIVAKEPWTKEIGIRITENGIDFLNEINKPILIKMLMPVWSFWVNHWKVLLPIVVAALVALFIHFDSKSASETKQEKKDTKTYIHNNTLKQPNQPIHLTRKGSIY